MAEIDIHICTADADDMHPYNCNPKDCKHCKRLVTEEHDPEKCALCCWNEDEDAS